MLTPKGLVFFCLGSLTALAGCGRGVNTPITPISQSSQPLSVVFLSSLPKSLAVQASAFLAAAATFAIAPPPGSANDLVTWSLTCGSPGACGVFKANADANGVTYVAPTVIPAGNTITITATSIATPAKSASTVITIVPPIPISVSFSPTPPASLQINTSTSLITSIANDVTANPQVQWIVTCSAAPCGAFSSATTASGVATTYTAPAAIPSGNTVTITASSVTDPTKSASTSIVVTPVTARLADGTYVFQFSVATGSQSSFTTGVFTAVNGTITGGEQDSNNFQSDSFGDLAPDPLQQKITGGTYATTSDGNIQVAIQIGAYETETLTGALASAGRGFVSAINGAPGSGTLDLQTSITAPAGGYVLSLSGGDQYADPAWISGIVNVDGAGSISGSGSTLDVVDGYAAYGGTSSVGTSTVSAPDSYGRVLFQLHTGSGSALPSIDLVGYMIDATHIRLIEVDDAVNNTNFQGVLGGSAIGQGASTGKFAATSLTGLNYVFGAQGTDTRGPLQLAGVLAFGGNNAVTGTLNWNDLSNNAQSPLPFTGTYTVDPTGRVTISNLTGSSFAYSMHLYLTGDGNGFLLSNDSNDNFNGQTFQQQAAPFTAASFAGTYAMSDSTYVTARGSGASEPVIASGSILAAPASSGNTIAGYADVGGVSPNFAVSGTFAPNANGIFQGTVAGFNPASRTTAGAFSLYLVDGAQGVLIETDNTQLNLGHLHLQ